MSALVRSTRGSVWAGVRRVCFIGAAAAVLSGCGDGGNPGDNSGGNSGDNDTSFVDSRDGQRYRMVTIGTQTWMAQNLNYAGGDGDTIGGCYDNDPSNCDVYGRLYDWATVMGLPATCNSTSCASQVQSPHQGICPAGWRVPSDADWTTLTNFVGSSTAGTRLSSTSGWNSGGNGTDNFGFSALPGGEGYNGNFYNVGDEGAWWSATEYAPQDTWFRYMKWFESNVNRGWKGKACQVSLRCVKN